MYLLVHYTRNPLTVTVCWVWLVLRDHTWIINTILNGRWCLHRVTLWCKVQVKHRNLQSLLPSSENYLYLCVLEPKILPWNTPTLYDTLIAWYGVFVCPSRATLYKSPHSATVCRVGIMTWIEDQYTGMTCVCIRITGLHLATICFNSSSSLEQNSTLRDH